mmetsp:Transcript_9873/g.12869  ORF Transcript_9873/g.12869 Transcript_9873/m.12869 type:complete len:127 (-) Transcript_9873:198-578(-)
MKDSSHGDGILLLFVWIYYSTCLVFLVGIIQKLIAFLCVPGNSYTCSLVSETTDSDVLGTNIVLCFLTTYSDVGPITVPIVFFGIHPSPPPESVFLTIRTIIIRGIILGCTQRQEKKNGWMKEWKD